jgi:two-component system chemotaxis response regulator CheY
MPLNVLVTDDSAVMRAMIVKTLRMSGLDLGDVVHASNGAEALAVLDAQWIDLAMVDINMPVMDGLELLKQIAQRPYAGGLRTIVVSTEGSDPRIAQVRAHGAEFVHKPFSPEDLRDVVLRVTGMVV